MSKITFIFVAAFLAVSAHQLQLIRAAATPIPSGMIGSCAPISDNKNLWDCAIPEIALLVKCTGLEPAATDPAWGRLRSSEEARGFLRSQYAKLGNLRNFANWLACQKPFTVSVTAAADTVPGQPHRIGELLMSYGYGESGVFLRERSGWTLDFWKWFSKPLGISVSIKFDSHGGISSIEIAESWK